MGKIILGNNINSGEEAGIFTNTGKYPALGGFDLSGWNSPPFGASYNNVVNATLNEVRTWHNRGGIVQMQCHWIHPENPNGSAWLAAHGSKTASDPFNFAEAVIDGSVVNGKLMSDLEKHANFLEILANEDIPILWRPYHEIDGGWFWWTCLDNPTYTAEIWRMMFNYFVNERGLNNLIWVYACATRIGNLPYNPDPIERHEAFIDVNNRLPFYPGDDYVDIIGIDIYENAFYGWLDPKTSFYRDAFNMLRQLAPSKMIALCESDTHINLDMTSESELNWLYTMPWWQIGHRNHPITWVQTCYNHPLAITGLNLY